MKKKLALLIFIFLTTISFSFPNSEFNVIESKNTLDANNLLLNINTVSKNEMLKSGISGSYADKIVEYRDITGGFVKLKDMTRIDGIGEKTYQKLKEKFKEVDTVKLKKFNINKVDNKTLTYYGFSKKDIKSIREYQEKNRIRNNLEIKPLISEKKYKELKDYIEY